MYRTFFGVTEKPFAISPDERYLFMTKKHQEALGHLIYGVEESGGFVMLSGEVGTGKTLMCRRMLSNLRDDVEVALCLNPRLTDLELLAVMCDELGIDYPKPAYSRKELLDRITAYLLDAYARGKRVTLLIDEAQDLDPQVLEQVRLLTNLETGTDKLLQIILVGQPELLQILSRSELRQVDQRITARYHLTALDRKEVDGYIRHRMTVAGIERRVFDSAAVRLIHRASGGVPRLVNSICDRCLLAAYVNRTKRVDKRIAKAAIREVQGQAPSASRYSLRPLLASGFAATLMATAVVAAIELGGLSPAQAIEPIREKIIALLKEHGYPGALESESK